jgi:hypothetical protein
VDDALRRPRGAGRVEDVDGVGPLAPHEVDAVGFEQALEAVPGAAAGIGLGGTDRDHVLELRQLEALEPARPARLDDQDPGPRVAQHVLEEGGLELDVERHVDRPGPGDALPGGEIVVRRVEHRRHPVAGHDPEPAQAGGDAPRPLAQRPEGEVAARGVDRDLVGPALGAIVDQLRDRPVAVVAHGPS